MTPPSIRIGLPRTQVELGERRDFLPKFVAKVCKRGAKVVLEHGYGSGMGFTEQDYFTADMGIRFVTREEAFQEEYVLVLRYPGDQAIQMMRPGACLISMLHYPTRPQRVKYMRSLGIEALSLDSIKDDNGKRLVENLRLVAWNGIEAAFKLLRTTYPPPGFENPERLPVRITLLGAGAVGAHVIQAAVCYGDNNLRKRLVAAGVPGVLVSVVDYDLTNHTNIMLELLSRTDILVDATQRRDPTVPVIPNNWIAYMPQHSVLLDLSVDPYDCEHNYVKGIEGIPQGNLDQFTFLPDDPAYDSLPDCVQTRHRRYAVSCYSWPGIYPQECMEIYGNQIQPLIRVLTESNGLENVRANGRFFERALSRAQLSRWILGKELM